MKVNLYGDIAIIFGFLAALCEIVFFVCIYRNMIKNKSISGWIFSDGTTKKEKILLLTCFLLGIIFALIGAYFGYLTEN